MRQRRCSEFCFLGSDRWLSSAMSSTLCSTQINIPQLAERVSVVEAKHQRNAAAVHHLLGEVSRKMPLGDDNVRHSATQRRNQQVTNYVETIANCEVNNAEFKRWVSESRAHVKHCLPACSNQKSTASASVKRENSLDTTQHDFDEPAVGEQGWLMHPRTMDQLLRRVSSLAKRTKAMKAQHNPFDSSNGERAQQLNGKLGTTSVQLVKSHSSSGRIAAAPSRENLNSTAHQKRSLLPDFLLVLDFEATCQQERSFASDYREHVAAATDNDCFIPEIIEFPVVVVDTSARKVVAEFHSYVRPTRNPTLSAFCIQLTGVQQHQVDAAPTLPEAIEQFNAWYNLTIPSGRTALFATDGPWDMRDFMYKFSVLAQDVKFPELFYKWIDVNKNFLRYFAFRSPARTRRIQGMLDYLGLSFEGRVHSGKDDAMNLARVIIAMLERGCAFPVTEEIEVLPQAASRGSSHLPSFKKKKKRQHISKIL